MQESKHPFFIFLYRPVRCAVKVELTSVARREAAVLLITFIALAFLVCFTWMEEQIFIVSENACIRVYTFVLFYQCCVFPLCRMRIEWRLQFCLLSSAFYLTSFDKVYMYKISFEWTTIIVSRNDNFTGSKFNLF